MPRKKKKIEDFTTETISVISVKEKPEINKSEWLTGTFKKVVTITKVSPKVEMVDSDGNIIIWSGRNYDTNKIKLNNILEIVGRAKHHINENDVKKTVIKYFTY